MAHQLIHHDVSMRLESHAHIMGCAFKLESATLQDFISISHVPLIAVQVIAYTTRHQLPTHGTCFTVSLHAFIQTAATCYKLDGISS